jgi:transposase
VARGWRDDRIAELERQLAERDVCIAELSELVAALRAQVAKFEEELRKNSGNSSKPPSTDMPSNKPPAKMRAPTGRKPGGQPGHKRHERPLVPLGEVNGRVIDHKPETCEFCGLHLEGDDPDPERHQVWEIPDVTPTVDEHRLHALPCACGLVTRARLPEGVPTGAFGPNVDATASLLSGAFRLSKRDTADAMNALCGLSMCEASVKACEERMSEALAAPFEEAHAFVKKQPIKHADETGWREARQKAWLWTVVTQLVTIFVITRTRTRDVARLVLGAAYGILNSDRLFAYDWWPVAWRQVCWSHLGRKFVAFAERGGESEAIGKGLLEEHDRMFAWWHRVRDGTLKRSTFQVYMRTVRTRVEALLAEGAALRLVKGTSASDLRTARSCAQILKVATALWTFVHVEGVEPTNNAAERAVRHGVIWRKISYGTHSAQGSRFVERILTTHATLTQQGRDVLTFLREARLAALHNRPPPSLLPAQSK